MNVLEINTGQDSTHASATRQNFAWVWRPNGGYREYWRARAANIETLFSRHSRLMKVFGEASPNKIIFQWRLILSRQAPMPVIDGNQQLLIDTRREGVRQTEEPIYVSPSIGSNGQKRRWRTENDSIEIAGAASRMPYAV